MKQRLQMMLIAVLISIGVALTCEQSSTQQPSLAATSGQESPEALASKSGCLRCHAVDKKVVGPPFRAVAERYKGDPRARKALFETVKSGGKGHWTELTGDVPMPPHSARLSAAEIQRLVDWVLSLHDGENK